jgi:hypothetical protein
MCGVAWRGQYLSSSGSLLLFFTIIGLYALSSGSDKSSQVSAQTHPLTASGTGHVT